MSTSAPWSRRELILLILAVVGWAGLAGTLFGQLSVPDQATQARRRAEDAEEMLARALRQSEEVRQTSEQLCKERELIVQTLADKVAYLEQRLQKYEP